MSRVRVSPTEWLDQGPAKASSYSAGFVIRQALTVGNMTPMRFGPAVTTPAERDRIERRRIHRVHHEFPNMERCGKPLRYLGESCARFVGHRDSCRSRRALDNAANR
jgi:hypothetical protein